MPDNVVVVNTHLICTQLPYATLSGELTFQCPLHITVNRLVPLRDFYSLPRWSQRLETCCRISEHRHTIHIFNIINKRNNSNNRLFLVFTLYLSHSQCLSSPSTYHPMIRCINVQEVKLMSIKINLKKVKLCSARRIFSCWIACVLTNY